MTSDSTRREDTALRAVREALTRMGVTLGGHELELQTLASAVYQHGGTYGIDIVGGSYHAEILPVVSGKDTPQGMGVGWTPAVALAFALIDALAEDADDGQ